MSDFCKTCGDFTLLPESHRCPPKMKLIDEDGEEYDVYAHDVEEAAAKWAEKQDQKGDYGFAKGDEENVTVIDNDGHDTNVHVWAEPSINYMANEQ